MTKSVKTSKREIVDYWFKNYDTRVKNLDFGEPQCWACGCWYKTAREMFPRAVITRDHCYAAWDSAPLQRCHIIPRSLGGPDEPSNLLLMCLDCHDMAPDTKSREAMLNWVTTQNYANRRENNLKRAFIDVVGSDDISLMSQYVMDELSGNLSKWISDHNFTGLHVHQITGKPIIKDSTKIAAWVEYRKSNEYTQTPRSTLRMTINFQWLLNNARQLTV